VFTRGTFVALIDVDVALCPDEAPGAAAVVAPGNHVRLADGPAVARVGRTSIVQVAEQTRLSWRALAVVVGHAIVTRAAVEARLLGAVVHVVLAVAALVAVDADAGVAVAGVGASGAVLADVGEYGALIHVDGAVFPRVLGWAVTSVCADTVRAFPAILAQVLVAVVDIHLAFVASEAVRAVAFEGVSVDVGAAAVILAGIWITGVIFAFTILPSEALLTNALVRPKCVFASPVNARVPPALVDVNLAVGPVESLVAVATV
jgi:hypothetical protein